MTDVTRDDSGVDLTTWRKLLSDWGRSGCLRPDAERTLAPSTLPL